MAVSDDLFAVHDVDLVDVMDELGLLADLDAGILGCEECEDPVTLKSIFALVPTRDNKVAVICTRPACVSMLHQHLQQEDASG